MPLHLIAVAESDSYLKWAVTLTAQLPPSTRVDLLVARSPVRPSSAQREAALAGTAWAGRELDVVTPGQLLRRVTRERPDAVLIACTGPSAHAFSEALSRSPHRPVLVAGIPGIALPARRRAWGFRGAIDLLVVHSHHEMAEYERVRVLTGKSGRIGLATIPFLVAGGHPEPPDLGALTDGGSDPAVGGGRRVVFATQAKVPRVRSERLAILLALDRLATLRPDLRVVVKTRGTRGEMHTHYEQHHYEDLWRRLVAEGRVGASDAVEFAAGSMADQLADAAALVTVSSTAVLEAMARNVPVLLIDEFGISRRLLNEVFESSGCLGGLDALAAADFRHPARRWLWDNYFHPTTDNTWIAVLEELVQRAASGGLPPVEEGLDPARSARRRRRDRWRLTPTGSALVRARQQARSRGLRPDRREAKPV